MAIPITFRAKPPRVVGTGLLGRSASEDLALAAPTSAGSATRTNRQHSCCPNPPEATLLSPHAMGPTRGGPAPAGANP